MKTHTHTHTHTKTKLEIEQKSRFTDTENRLVVVSRERGRAKWDRELAMLPFRQAGPQRQENHWAGSNRNFAQAG